MKSETDYASMIISKESVEISFLNKSTCAVHNITLHTGEFNTYTYNISDEEGNLFKEYPIAFETNELFNTTKNIGRRDSIKLYWLPGDNNIIIQPIKTGSKDPGRASALFVKILTMEHIRYSADSYATQPNVKIYAKDFADLCSQASTLRCVGLEITTCSNAVIFKGVLPNKAPAFINKFATQREIPKATKVASNIEEINTLLSGLNIQDNCRTNLSLNIVSDGDLAPVVVPISTIKALSKIHNISPSGTLLRLYFEEKKPIKIESPIGTYGQYVICLRNRKK